MTAVIGPGCRVTLHYTLQLGDGTLVDSTRDNGPATIKVGAGDLVDLLENQLLGMSAGEHRQIRLSASETMTLASGESAQHVPRQEFPAGMEIRVGQVIGFALPNGQEIPGLVLEVTADEIVVDFDHPLAGRDLNFNVEILSVESA